MSPEVEAEIARLRAEIATVRAGYDVLAHHLSRSLEQNVRIAELLDALDRRFIGPKTPPDIAAFVRVEVVEGTAIRRHFDASSFLGAIAERVNVTPRALPPASKAEKEPSVRRP